MKSRKLKLVLIYDDDATRDLVTEQLQEIFNLTDSKARGYSLDVCAYDNILAAFTEQRGKEVHYLYVDLSSVAPIGLIHNAYSPIMSFLSGHHGLVIILSFAGAGIYTDDVANEIIDLAKRDGINCRVKKLDFADCFQVDQLKAIFNEELP